MRSTPGPLVSGTPGGGNAAPEFLLAMTARTWAQPFTNTPTDVAPSPLPAGTSGFAGLFAWGGGRVTQSGIRLFGGGDLDYGGNEDYLGSLSSLTFTRLHGPSASSGGTATTWGDGQPRPPHTYRHLVERRVNGVATHLYVTSLAGPYGSNNSFPHVWKRALPSGDWTSVGTLPGSWFAPSLECGAVYSESRDRIYVFTPYGEPWTIDCSSDTLNQAGAIPEFVAGAGADNALEIIDQAGAVVFWANDGSVSVMSLDAIDAETPAWSAVTVSGTFGVSTYPGLAWHKRSKKLIGWGHSTNRENLFTLAPPTANPTQFSHLTGTWNAATVTPHASNSVTPSSPDTNGTHGRFGIVEYDEIDAAVLINAVNQEPYVYALDAV